MSLAASGWLNSAGATPLNPFTEKGQIQSLTFCLLGGMLLGAAVVTSSYFQLSGGLSGLCRNRPGTFKIKGQCCVKQQKHVTKFAI